ncbi:hypothetical protein QOZ80_5BG0417760 [Eleusine coracana subsp. coracana]|nr:hypothetical protein QOZ80_5BG0417760 [Eleusine coracana subsp. coracana]
MALSQSTQLGLATASFGVLSFVLAELKKPPAGLGALAVFFPYGGRRVPRKALLGYTPLYVFFHVAVGVTVAGLGMTMWPTVAEAAHRVRNVHRDPGYACPTAKTGVLGGAAFLNLNAMLFWIVCLMLAGNVREDYFDDGDGDAEGGVGIELN